MSDANRDWELEHDTVIGITWLDHGDPDPDWTYHLRMGGIDCSAAVVVAHDGFDHTSLHQAIAEAIAAHFGPEDHPLDAATSVMDMLVIRRVIPPPQGYTVKDIA